MGKVQHPGRNQAQDNHQRCHAPRPRRGAHGANPGLPPALKQNQHAREEQHESPDLKLGVVPVPGLQSDQVHDGEQDPARDGSRPCEPGTPETPREQGVGGQQMEQAGIRPPERQPGLQVIRQPPRVPLQKAVADAAAAGPIQESDRHQRGRDGKGQEPERARQRTDGLMARLSRAQRQRGPENHRRRRDGHRDERVHVDRVHETGRDAERQLPQKERQARVPASFARQAVTGHRAPYQHGKTDDHQ
jgi:hypothetical protein